MGTPCLFLHNANRANDCESSDEPSKLPETRPPASSHSPEPTSSACNKRARGCLRPMTETSTVAVITTRKQWCCLFGFTSDVSVSTDPINGATKTCDGARWPQPCLHYSSVIDYHQRFVGAGEPGYNPLTCPEAPRGNPRAGGEGQQITVDWTDQHDSRWCVLLSLWIYICHHRLFDPSLVFYLH